MHLKHMNAVYIKGYLDIVLVLYMVEHNSLYITIYFVYIYLTYKQQIFLVNIQTTYIISYNAISLFRTIIGEKFFAPKFAYVLVTAVANAPVVPVRLSVSFSV